MSLADSDEVFVLNGDTYFDISLARLFSFHGLKKAKLSIALKLLENFERYGIIKVDSNNKIVDYKLFQWAKNKDYLKIAYDEVSISTKILVNVTLKALDQRLTGLYHSINSESASRYEWAKEAFKLKGIKKFIYSVSKQVFNLDAKRPKFSIMSDFKIKEALNINIRNWEELQVSDLCWITTKM